MTFQLLALCFGNFIIGTGTMIVPGMLPALAEGLNVSLPVAGQLVTVFAVSIGITAPPAEQHYCPAATVTARRTRPKHRASGT